MRGACPADSLSVAATAGAGRCAFGYLLQRIFRKFTKLFFDKENNRIYYGKLTIIAKCTVVYRRIYE